VQFTERFINAAGGVCLSGIAYPYFGGKEKLVTGHTAASDGIAHALFIIVSLRQDGKEYAGPVSTSR